MTRPPQIDDIGRAIYWCACGIAGSCAARLTTPRTQLGFPGIIVTMPVRGYVGPFYAQLVAGGPALSTGAIKAFDDGSTGLATSFCNTYGYTNLAQAE
jgi:hypothetical protein